MKLTRKQKWFYGFIIASLIKVAVVGLWLLWSYVHQPTLSMELLLPDNSVIEVEVADTFWKQERGLMDRSYLDQNHGMLFVFYRPARHSFWMKNTKIDLDYVWMLDGVVVELTPRVPAGDGLPNDQIATVTPKTEVNWVLEVPAGFITEHHLQVGDRLDETPSVF